MEIGSLVLTLVDKKTKERDIDVFIPANTEGIVCDVSDSWVFIEAKVKELPEGIGVFAYNISELKLL